MVDASRPAAAGLCLVILLTLLVPLGIRAVDARYGGAGAPPTYLPALEGPRDRHPFEPERIEELARLNPGLVVIGDSMAGTRVSPARLGELSGRPVAMLLHAGSGSAFWYLAIKNWVIPGGIRPRAVLVFFRDTNLTNVMFRLDEGFRWNVDRAARDREDELNQVIASRVGALRYRTRAAIERTYHVDRARLWMEPSVTNWLRREMIPSRRQRTDFIARMNARFDFAHMRPMQAADISASDDPDTDFDADVDRSVLPLMLRDATRAGLTLCFVRVQRRPVGGRPPAQSAALQRYVSRLAQYIEAHGGRFRDDTGDPALTLDMYEDGDHLAMRASRRYTEILYDRLRPLLP